MKTTWNDIEILVIGAGTMGGSLVQNYAQSGFNVGVLDVSEEALQRGLNTIDRELDSAKGRIFSPRDIQGIRSRIVGGTNYEEACGGSSLKLVIESATERIDVKQKIFQTLDKLTRKEAVLATNSSSLDTNILAQATNRPDKVVWMHYFYLPHKNRACEYAGTDTASEASKQVARSLIKLGGKIPTHVLKSRKGGVADIIFVALLLEATRMLEEGYDIPSIEAAAKAAYNIPIGFFELMDATGLPIGVYSMESFSDSTRADDPLYQVYGNFFAPRKNYVDLVKQWEGAADKSAVRWISNGNLKQAPVDAGTVSELTDRFLAIGFVTASECVDAGLITIPDLELLAQNAFLWRRGPFTIMEEIGGKRVCKAVGRRAEIAKSLGQDFPISGMLKKIMDTCEPARVSVSPVLMETEMQGAVRRITLANLKSSNALNNEVFAELKREFAAANSDPACKVIVFDTAPIKSFIAGADIKVFIERVKAKDFEAIRRDTAEWQHVMFHVMTGTDKPKVAIVDGQAFGGGVEMACALAIDPNTAVLITNRTTFALPETKLGIFPGLRGTLNLPQLIYRKTGDAEQAVALARYYMLAAGTATTSPQMIYHLGLADAIVPQHRRDEAAAVVADAIIRNGGRMLTEEQLEALKFERIPTRLSPGEAEELRVATEIFNQVDVLFTLYAEGRGHLPCWYTGDTKGFADRITRRVTAASPHAVTMTNYLIGRGFEGFLRSVDNDTLAAWELEHHLVPIFEHPDALIGLESLMQGKFPEFRRRYPL